MTSRKKSHRGSATLPVEAAPLRNNIIPKQTTTTPSSHPERPPRTPPRVCTRTPSSSRSLNSTLARYNTKVTTRLLAGDRPPLEQHLPLAAAERSPPGEQVQQGALPAAAGSHQGAQSAPRDPPVHGVQELLTSRRGGGTVEKRSPFFLAGGLPFPEQAPGEQLGQGVDLRDWVPPKGLCLKNTSAYVVSAYISLKGGALDMPHVDTRFEEGVMHVSCCLRTQGGWILRYMYIV